MKKKFPICHQHDSMQCGITCLQMVCKYYGKKYSLDQLSTVCFATNEGVSLLGMSDAATTLGLDVTCVRTNISALMLTETPVILHWNQNHFVVLYKIKDGKKFYIADPGKGRIVYNTEDFLSHWCSNDPFQNFSGIAMFLEPTDKFYSFDFDYLSYANDGESHSFRFLYHYAKKFRISFAFVILGLFVGCLLQLILPYLTQAIVDIGIKNKDIGFVWLILLGQLILTVSRTAIDFIRRWILLRVSVKINISLVSDFFIKLLKLPMGFFDTKLVGDLIQRMNDHNRVNSFLTQKLLNLSFSTLTLIVFSIVLLYYNPLVFLIFLAGSAIYGCWMVIFLKRRKELDYMLFEQQAQNNNKTYEFITSMQEIKLQNCEERRRQEWENIQKDLLSVQMKTLKLQQAEDAGSIFINEVKNIVITVVAASAVINNDMTLGMMLAVQYIIGQLNSPVSQLTGFIYSIQDMKISLERINEIHHMKEEDESKTLMPYIGNIWMGIRIKDISFQYDLHSRHKTLDHLNFEIPYGKVTAIVGASGSGKTTLIKLLLGYYPVSEGEINIGGTSMRYMKKKWWRNQCGVVMQDGIIFSESIGRNIAVGDGEINTEKLHRAASIANIHDYIMSLPLKYDTKIGRDGVGLSQGQKQRILIARAAYKDPNFIFLDEATNSLDAKNERQIVENLNKFYENKTVVIVAHRLSTVRNADQIIVLDEGKIVEMGNHESLTELHGVYYNLVKNQLDLGN